MAISFLQGDGTQSSGQTASLPKAFASNVVAGSLIWVGIVKNSQQPVAGEVTDGQSNTYTQDTVSAGGFYSAIYTAVAGSSGALTVTYTSELSDFVSIAIAEFSPGSDTWSTTAANRRDGTPVSASGNDAAPASGNITTTTANVTVGVMTQNEGSTSITPGGSYTQIYENENVTNSMPISAEYKLNASSGTENATWSMGATRLWRASAAAYKVTVSGGGGGTVCHLSTDKGWVF